MARRPLPATASGGSIPRGSGVSVLTPLLRKGLVGLGGLALVGVADAQDAPQTPAPAESMATQGYGGSLSAQDQSTLRQAVDAAQAGDVARAQTLQAGLSDPVARKVVLWAMADSAPERLPFAQLDQARSDLRGWPRAARRQIAAERGLEAQALPPKAVIEWFKGQDPTSPEGAMALAAAYRVRGDNDLAKALIRRFWLEKPFEADAQRAMLARFGDYLTMDDHIRRTDMLLYGQQGPAARDMIALLPPDQQLLAQARMAFRDGESKGELIMEQLPPNLQDAPGLAFERARYFRHQKQASLALSLLKLLPTDPPSDEAGSAVWAERKAMVGAALAARDYATAYQAAAGSGLHPGVDYAEAEFYAGWIALTKLNRPDLADAHFSHIAEVGASPITQGRAFYWRGRAQEAEGDPIGAQASYAQGAEFNTTFYGQLAAERAGFSDLVIGHDPNLSEADRNRFEKRDMVRAARMLYAAGERDLFRAFALCMADNASNTAEVAMLVDLTRGYGEQDLSMRVSRLAAQHGYVLPDRGYPVLAASPVGGGAEPALVLSIARQESNFDPGARSGPGARGVMQLMPSTAQIIARRMGEPYSPDRLYDADYNVRIGSSYLGGMIGNFGGSYIMATAAYNAVPNHMPDWTAMCGDPRTNSGDPVNFIECIPISETRNYVMRVMETMEVYRARLNGGRAPLTLSRDLKRGVYTPAAPPLLTPTPTVAQSPTAATTVAAAGAGSMAPIPD